MWCNRAWCALQVGPSSMCSEMSYFPSIYTEKSWTDRYMLCGWIFRKLIWAQFQFCFANIYRFVDSVFTIIIYLPYVHRYVILNDAVWRYIHVLFCCLFISAFNCVESRCFLFCNLVLLIYLQSICVLGTHEQEYHSN